VCAALARAYADAGERVLAVDADPNNCLGEALGFPPELLAKITPLSEMKEMLAERAGTAEGGGFFALNPRVDDLLERYGVSRDGITLLVMGSITQAASGCVCPESAVLRALTRHLIEQEMVVLLDMEAGIEHLGRGTSQYMDMLLIVTEPTLASLHTVLRIADLARQLVIPRLGVVGNKIASDRQRKFIEESLDAMEILGFLSLNERVQETDITGEAVFSNNPRLVEEVNRIRERIDRA
jgi:CO dehydrogenase maturation factor